MNKIDLNADMGTCLLTPGSNIDGNTGISLLVHGHPGSGKTSLIKTLLGWKHGKGYVNKPYCKGEEICVIDVEAGADTILIDEEHKRVCTIFPVREEADSLSRFKNFIRWLHDNEHPFKFVVVDNMSELEKFFLMMLTKSKDLEVPRQKEWGDDAFYMRKYIRDLISLTYKGINVIFNFWSMAMPIQGIDNQMIVPMVMRSTTLEYVGLVEHTAYIGTGDKGVRFLQFESNDLIKCKYRDPGNSKPLLNAFEEPNLASVFRKLKGEKE